jgi:nitroimidazol reductase NimA-like FMN-containing flavoprotein (pyridoxamine 5'-phosphate oxidase superfamily)
MDREMRRKDRQVTDPEWLEAVLQGAKVLELGLIGTDGWPYVVPLCYGYEKGVLYLHGASEGLKADLVASGAKACFQIYLDAEVIQGKTASSFSMKYRSVTGFGRVTRLDGRAEKEKGLNVLMKHFDGPPMVLGENHGRIWVARLDIERMTGKSNPGS